MGVGRGTHKINGVADLLHETQCGGGHVPRAPLDRRKSRRHSPPLRTHGRVF